MSIVSDESRRTSTTTVGSTVNLIKKEDDICLAEEQPEDNKVEHTTNHNHYARINADAKKPFMKKLTDLSKSCYPKRPKVVNVMPRSVPLNDDVVRSGHLEFQTLYAANDVVTPNFVVNGLGAPNDSTMVCGCENISCPFCNIVLSINNRDPALDAEALRRKK